MDYKNILKNLTLTEKCTLLSGDGVWHSHAIERVGLPAIAFADGPSGLRKQAGAGDHLGLNASVPSTCWPSASTVANSWDTALAELVGTGIGTEAAEKHVDVLLGPGLNTKRNPLCGRNFEYFSEDPYLSGKLAAGYIRGIQSQGVASCPKHFAANGQELRRMASDSVVDARTLHELYLTNFEIAVKEGSAKSIMSAYNRINGVYAHENKWLLGDTLAGWGFDGAVVSDWGGGNDIVASTRAGGTIEMPGTGGDSARQLERAVHENRLLESDLDARVEELLKLASWVTDQDRGTSVDEQKQHDLARRVAEESAVLLKNENDILPLASDCRVAVIGDFIQSPRYQGAGSSVVNATQVETTQNEIEQYFANCIGYAQGFHRADHDDTALITAATALAKQADVVLLYLGLPEVFETEGQDRSHMRLPENQINLLLKLAETNKNIIVVLSAGSAIEMPFLASCKALVYGGLAGQAGATAMLRVLTGAVNPSGKLAETFPIMYSDVPSGHYYPGKERTSEYREGIYVGYRYFNTVNKPVQFPFGFGLSYTDFAYSDMKVGGTSVSFAIENVGDCAGAEVAQLYIGMEQSELFRAKRELKGFAKVYLEAGASARVTIELDDKAFRYYNITTQSYEIESGRYCIEVGPSIENLPLRAAITQEGTGAHSPYLNERVTCYQTVELDSVADDEFAYLLGHDIPEAHWDTTAPLGMNDTIAQMCYAKSALARMAYRVLTKMKDKSIDSGTPDLNILFIYNMPFRGIAKMANGMVTMKMAEGILVAVNGHFFKGLGAVISGYFHRKKI